MEETKTAIEIFNENCTRRMKKINEATDTASIALHELMADPSFINMVALPEMPSCGGDFVYFDVEVPLANHFYDNPGLQQLSTALEEAIAELDPYSGPGGYIAKAIDDMVLDEIITEGLAAANAVEAYDRAMKVVE
jgi:hypothetical protein